MRTRRFRDEQIVGILQEHAAGERTGALCRRHGISEQTLYRGNASTTAWKGMSANG
jgi:putative transposase